jgi:hypothetical protein
LNEGEYIDGLVPTKSNKLIKGTGGGPKTESSRVIQKLIDKKVHSNKIENQAVYQEIESSFETFKEKFSVDFDLDGNFETRLMGKKTYEFGKGQNPEDNQGTRSLLT